MNMINRSFLYLLRKKGKTFSLLAFLLVMATMMLTCLSLFSATQDAGANLKKALMGSFTVNAKQLECGLNGKTIQEILGINGLSGQYNLRSYTQASYYDSNNRPLTIETEGAASIPEGYEHAGKVVADSNSDKGTYFTEAGFKLVEGNPITPEVKNAVLLHKDFAEKNGLSIGDKMFLESVTETGRRVEVTVAGLFTNTEEQDAIGVAPSYDLFPNVTFTDISTCSELLYGNAGNNSQYGDFYVNDPEELSKIMAAVKKIPDTAWEKCVITKYDKDYQNAKGALEGLQNIIFAAMIIISVICFIVLSLFLIFRLRSRIHETGVLLAMGISKRSILAQHLLEIIFIASLAFLMSFATSSMISQKVGDTLFSHTMKNNYEVVQFSENNQDKSAKQTNNEEMMMPDIEVSISMRDYFAVWGIGIFLCTASTMLAIIPILQMKPKNILSQMN